MSGTMTAAMATIRYLILSLSVKWEIESGMSEGKA
jgi:hypothetical protein